MAAFALTGLIGASCGAFQITTYIMSLVDNTGALKACAASLFFNPMVKVVFIHPTCQMSIALVISPNSSVRVSTTTTHPLFSCTWNSSMKIQTHFLMPFVKSVLRLSIKSLCVSE